MNLGIDLQGTARVVQLLVEYGLCRTDGDKMLGVPKLDEFRLFLYLLPQSLLH